MNQEQVKLSPIYQSSPAHSLTHSHLAQGRGRGRGSASRGGGASTGRGGGAAGKGDDKPRREAILDLSKYVDKRVRVKFTGGREGKLCFSSPSLSPPAPDSDLPNPPADPSTSLQSPVYSRDTINFSTSSWTTSRNSCVVRALPRPSLSPPSLDLTTEQSSATLHSADSSLFPPPSSSLPLPLSPPFSSTDPSTDLPFQPHQFRSLGLAVLRGTSLVVLSPVDGYVLPTFQSSSPDSVAQIRGDCQPVCRRQLGI